MKFTLKGLLGMEPETNLEPTAATEDKPALPVLTDDEMSAIENSSAQWANSLVAAGTIQPNQAELFATADAFIGHASAILQLGGEVGTLELSETGLSGLELGADVAPTALDVFRAAVSGDGDIAPRANPVQEAAKVGATANANTGAGRFKLLGVPATTAAKPNSAGAGNTNTNPNAVVDLSPSGDAITILTDEELGIIPAK